ncbi:hypothetical protein M527_15020 [Sphingobium indicum IP26]|uniref:Uncharacterized protein n=1 Tax=Sphingobium indicum F2 TaxID=1450518 RepID=A0A8E0WQ12_9SPHN|nr:hypothetical protein M527_15020 [Sphingobium indicum IP26]KER35336.1 hypothetical protein AL00_17320 [Sphingobium indicum F2]
MPFKNTTSSGAMQPLRAQFARHSHGFRRVAWTPLRWQSAIGQFSFIRIPSSSESLFDMKVEARR